LKYGNISIDKNMLACYTSFCTRQARSVECGQTAVEILEILKLTF